MGSRKLRGGRSVRLPDFEVDDLAVQVAAFRGEIDLDLAHVDGGDQAGVVGEGLVSHCLVERVDFAGAQFVPLSLDDVVFRDVDLSNAVLHRVAARRVEFLQCRAIGLRLTLDHAADVVLSDCRLDYANIRVERVKGVLAFQDCSFREAVISGDLSNVVFENCDFTGAEFDVAKAEKCDFRSSSLAGARGLISLRGAEISTEQAVSVAVRLAVEVGFKVVD
jgi:uncharacterized protein YjbI with pentapeptide repeats